MSVYFIICVSAVLGGLTLLVYGLSYRVYVLPEDFGRYEGAGFCWIKRLLSRVEKALSPPKNSAVYKTIEKLLTNSGIEMPVSRFWFYKSTCVILTFIILAVVSLTNTNVLKQDIMGSWLQEKSFASTPMTSEEYKYNVSLYKEVVSRIGENNLKKLTDEKKSQKVAAILKELDGRNTAGSNADGLVKAFNRLEGMRVITINILLSSVAAFFIPEIMLFLRKLIVGKKYKNEAVKMQNIFGLLGSMEDYKTIFILKDMAAASKVFGKQLNHAALIFYTDKTKSFDYLKSAIRERSFVRLIDTMRVYSTVDKKLALTILERNIKEQEEQLLLSAEEDMDVVDILAFLSVVPVLYEVANLLINPMLEVIFNVFNFI